MSRRPTSLVAIGCSVAATLAFAVAPTQPGSPSAPTDEVAPMATDVAGDANALNGQGLEDVGSTPTPAQIDEADILGARITSTWDTVRGADGLLDHVFTGVEFRTALAAEPTATSVPILHRFIGTIDGCETWVQFAAGTAAGAAHGTATVRQYDTGCGIPDDPNTGLRGSRTFDGPGITWSWDVDNAEAVVTIDAAKVDAALGDTLVPDALYLLTELQVRHYSAAGITAPVIDEMPGQNGYAHLGSDVPADQEPGDPGEGHDGGDGNGVPRDTTPVCSRYGPADGTTPTTGSDRTGASADTLTLGLHAPATGAAPLPTTSFEQGRDLYWRSVTEDCGETVLGRSTVEVEYRDDKFSPEEAIQVCRELAASSFVVLGTTGTDQIKACGQLADAQGFPYVSPGVTEAGLHDNPWYFASTMTYRQQGGLLADYVATNPDGLDGLGPDTTLGTIITSTPNYDDAEAGWLQGVADNGLTMTETFRHPRGDTSWYGDTARRFRDAGIETIYWLGSAVDLLNFANTATSQFAYNPRYIGPWQDAALNATLQSGCGTPGAGIDGGVWLSPIPGLDAAPTAFFEAAAIFDTPSDDVALQLWATAEQQHELLAGYGGTFGTDLTREDFRAFVEGGASDTDGTFPATSWREHGHFGSTATHVVQANCELGEHVTLHVDVADF